MALQKKKRNIIIKYKWKKNILKQVVKKKINYNSQRNSFFFYLQNSVSNSHRYCFSSNTTFFENWIINNKNYFFWNYLKNILKNNKISISSNYFLNTLISLNNYIFFNNLTIFNKWEKVVIYKNSISLTQWFFYHENSLCYSLLNTYIIKYFFTFRKDINLSKHAFLSFGIHTVNKFLNVNRGSLKNIYLKKSSISVYFLSEKVNFFFSKNKNFFKSSNSYNQNADTLLQRKRKNFYFFNLCFFNIIFLKNLKTLKFKKYLYKRNICLSNLLIFFFNIRKKFISANRLISFNNRPCRFSSPKDFLFIKDINLYIKKNSSHLINYYRTKRITRGIEKKIFSFVHFRSLVKLGIFNINFFKKPYFLKKNCKILEFTQSIYLNIKKNFCFFSFLKLEKKNVSNHNLVSYKKKIHFLYAYSIFTYYFSRFKNFSLIVKYIKFFINN